MKIAYLASCPIPSVSASSIHVMRMCQAFSRNGHDVSLYALNGSRRVCTKDVFEQYGVDSCFVLHRLTNLPVRGNSQIMGFRSARRLISERPDLVYSRNIAGSYFAARNGLPTIFEFHAPIEESGWLAKYLFEKLIQSENLRRVVLITNALKRHFTRRYPDIESKLYVAADGADPISEDIEPIDLPNPSGRMQVGYVGHLYVGKGMELISALAPLCPWADFNVVGGRRGDLAHWKDVCKQIPNILFHGHVLHGNAAQYMRSFDVLVLPNQQNVSGYGRGGDIGRWTSPLKAFEYMAVGKPIIASAIPVLQEVLMHESNCLLCPPDDPSQWMLALKRLRQDRALGQRIAGNAKQQLLDHYTWSIRAAKVLSFTSASA